MNATTSNGVACLIFATLRLQGTYCALYLPPMDVITKYCVHHILHCTCTGTSRPRSFHDETLNSNSPSDIMIVAGTLTNKMAPALRKVYDQMPEPRTYWEPALVIAVY